MYWDYSLELVYQCTWKMLPLQWAFRLLGRRCSEDRLGTSTKSINTINRPQHPLYQAELRPFFCLCPFFWQFEPPFERITAKLNWKLEMDQISYFERLTICEIDALDTLQHWLLSLPILSLPKATWLYTLETDACDKQVMFSHYKRTQKTSKAGSVLVTIDIQGFKGIQHITWKMFRCLMGRSTSKTRLQRISVSYLNGSRRAPMNIEDDKCDMRYGEMVPTTLKVWLWSWCQGKRKSSCAQGLISLARDQNGLLSAQRRCSDTNANQSADKNGKCQTGGKTFGTVTLVMKVWTLGDPSC